MMDRYHSSLFLFPRVIDACSSICHVRNILAVFWEMSITGKFDQGVVAEGVRGGGQEQRSTHWVAVTEKIIMSIVAVLDF